MQQSQLRGPRKDFLWTFSQSICGSILSMVRHKQHWYQSLAVEQEAEYMDQSLVGGVSPPIDLCQLQKDIYLLRQWKLTKSAPSYQPST